MKNVKLLISMAVAMSVLLSGCGKNITAQEITIEAGDRELLEVLCAHEGIKRIGDPSYTINVTNNDDWNPFAAGKSYDIDYVIVSNNKTEEKRSISISIIDTMPPFVQRRPGHSDIVLPYVEDIEQLERSIKELIIESVVITDNSSTFPLVISEEDITLSKFDNKIINEKQDVSFRIEDGNGNTTESSIEVLIKNA